MKFLLSNNIEKLEGNLAVGKDISHKWENISHISYMWDRISHPSFPTYFPLISHISHIMTGITIGNYLCGFNNNYEKTRGTLPWEKISHISYMWEKISHPSFPTGFPPVSHIFPTLLQASR
jgi:hypothetical protein